MNTLTILNKRISFCPNIRTKSYQPITLFDALNSIRTNVYGEQIKNIRKLLHNGTFNLTNQRKNNCLRIYFQVSLMATGTNLTSVVTLH